VTWSLPAAASQPFLGQIEYYGFNFAPRGWTQCDGQLLPINNFQSLFSLLGTTFGGDGRTNFALPDMRGRVPVHDGGSAGSGLTRRPLGQKGGEEQHILTAAELPAHTHSLRGSTNPGNQVLPAGNALANDAPDETYRDEAPNTDMRAGSVGATSSGAHENMPPFLVINCTIALQGLFPSRN
jgi:microcystin-dependent protein